MKTFTVGQGVNVSTGHKAETRPGVITKVLPQIIGTHYYVTGRGHNAYCYSPVSDSLVLVKSL